MAKSKLFLARFTFHCGGAELPFEHTVFARNAAEVKKKVSTHLRTFAGDPRRTGNLSYEYYGGYYAVSYNGATPATADSVVQDLLLPTA